VPSALCLSLSALYAIAKSHKDTYIRKIPMMFVFRDKVKGYTIRLSIFICLLKSTNIFAKLEESASFPDADLKNIGISPSPEHIKSTINCFKSGL
jgi:hypothetical protein